MPRFLSAALLALALAAVARADVFTLKDGSTVSGSVVGSADDAFLVRLADGSTRRVLKDQVAKHETGDAPPAAAVPAPATPVVLRMADLTGDERIAALRKAAREGLALRARLVVGARELSTFMPLKVAGGYALSAQPRTLDLDQATFSERSVDEVAHDLWDRRAKPAEERFRALRAVAGMVSWAEAEVLSAAPSGDATEAVLDVRAVVIRGKTKIRVLDADSVKPRAIIRLPIALLVRQEEGAQFLAGQMGDSVSVWPMDFVPIAAEVGAGGRAPRTVAADLAQRVGERSVADAVKDWYSIRTRIQCPACKGTRKVVCPACNGAGGISKDYMDMSDGSQNGPRWYVCGRCSGTGFHACQLCQDGLDSRLLKESLRRFGTYGKPLGGFLVEGQKIVLDADAKGASVTTWIREKPNDQPRPETLRFVQDEKTGGWRPG
jgi:hypothetical protein